MWLPTRRRRANRRRLLVGGRESGGLLRVRAQKEATPSGQMLAA